MKIFLPSQIALSIYTNEELNNLDQIIVQAITKELGPNDMILKLNSKVTFEQLVGNKSKTIVWWCRCNLPCVHPYRVCSSKLGQQQATHWIFKNGAYFNLTPGKNDPTMAIKKFLESATHIDDKVIQECVICLEQHDFGGYCKQCGAFIGDSCNAKMKKQECPICRMSWD
jgi:hypothetical protein